MVKARYKKQLPKMRNRNQKVTIRKVTRNKILKMQKMKRLTVKMQKKIVRPLRKKITKNKKIQRISK